MQQCCLLPAQRRHNLLLNVAQVMCQHRCPESNPLGRVKQRARQRARQGVRQGTTSSMLQERKRRANGPRLQLWSALLACHMAQRQQLLLLLLLQGPDAEAAEEAAAAGVAPLTLLCIPTGIVH